MELMMQSVDQSTWMSRVTSIIIGAAPAEKASRRQRKIFWPSLSVWGWDHFNGRTTESFGPSRSQIERFLTGAGRATERRRDHEDSIGGLQAGLMPARGMSNR